mgnify:CR=1 FL=1
MKNKEFREIQVSSSLLVVIFLGVLALGVFIFLLGVSVGKKQVRLAAPTQVVTQQIPEPVKEPSVRTTPPAGAAAEEPAPPAAAKQAPPAAAPAAKPAAESRAAAAPANGLYYVQVAAFTDRAQARALADRFKGQGYAAVVADPKPTDAKTWYRVRLGGYPSRDRAVALLDKLNAAAGKKTDYRVVQD